MRTALLLFAFAALLVAGWLVVERLRERARRERDQRRRERHLADQAAWEGQLQRGDRTAAHDYQRSDESAPH